MKLPMRWLSPISAMGESGKKKQGNWVLPGKGNTANETTQVGCSLMILHNCFLFHDLKDHSILSLQDIVDIEDIWWKLY